MFSRIKGFVSRHRRKFIVGGIVVGGTVLAVRYAQRKLREFNENQAREFIEQTRRMQHFESTERTCNQAILGLSTNLCDEIIKLLSTDEILEQLRHNPDNKLNLWEELKIICFTRLTTLIYASSMLVVTLRVQLNLLGGYLYKDTVTDGTKISEEVRQAYLSLIQYFLTDGLEDLVTLIKSKVSEIMKSYPLTQKLTLADIEQVFWSIQMSVNSDKSEPNSKLALYVLPKSVNDSGLLKKMFTETLDMLESDDVAVLCSNNISRGFSIAVDHIAEYYAATVKSNKIVEIPTDQPSTSKEHLNSVVNINKIDMPLAKLIPIVNGATSKTFDCTVKPQNLATSLVTFFLVSEKIKTLGANVYEVFSV